MMGKQGFHVETESNMMIQAIKEKFKAALKFKNETIEFKFQGNVLEDGQTAAQCGLTTKCTINAAVS